MTTAVAGTEVVKLAPVSPKINGQDSHWEIYSAANLKERVSKTVDPRAHENSELGDTFWKRTSLESGKVLVPQQGGLQERSHISAVVKCLHFILFLMEVSTAVILLLSHHSVLGWGWGQLTCPFSLQVPGPDSGTVILQFEESASIMRCDFGGKGKDILSDVPALGLQPGSAPWSGSRILLRLLELLLACFTSKAEEDIAGKKLAFY